MTGRTRRARNRGIAARSVARLPAPRHAWLYVLILALAAGHLVYLGVRGPPRQAPHPRFGELRDVDPALLDELRPVKWRRDFGRDEEPEAFRRIARAHGAEGARAILYLLLEKYAGPRRSVTDEFSATYEDEEHETPGMLLGELADDGVVELLLRALPLREAHPAFRRSLAVALCREKFRDVALAPVVDRVLDRQEDNGFREMLLLRLHRFRGPPPPRLRDLLYQPFGRLDIFAAGALARMGDPEAPSLVLAGLELLYDDDSDAWHFAEATERVTGKDLPFEKDLVVYSRADGVFERATEERLQPHREALAACLETAPKTEFERTRRAELTLHDFDDVLAAGNDFDLAEASMLTVGYKPKWIRFHLERLNHFADFLRAKLRNVTDPEARIAVLNEWCLKRNTSVNATSREYGFVSFLPTVLREDYGNCLGYSTLYVALADRLDLPLFGVAAPRHCFVRYDDGKTRRNIEATAGGCEVPDAEYFDAAQRAAAPDTLQRGVFLRNLDKRGMLSLVCANRATALARQRCHEESADVARRGLQLDPRNPNVCLAYAHALFNLRLDNEPHVTDALRDAIDLWPGDVEACLTAGRILMEYGQLERARSYFARAHGLAGTPETRAWLAICRARQGDPREALATLELAIAQAPDSGVVRMAELEARLRMNPNDAERIVPELAQATGQPLALHTAAARILIETDHPRLALEQLDRVDELAKRTRKELFPQSGPGELVDLQEFNASKRAYYLTRVSALYAIAHDAAARAALKRAEEAGAHGYLMLKARRTLDGG